MNRFTYILGVLLILSLSACGGSDADRSTSDDANGQAAASQTDGLTDEQIEKGIGPVTEVELGPIEESLAQQGQEVFKTKCSACHKMEERYVGPPLGDVTERRAPEFVMNMILNPEEMVKKHPEAKALLAQYMTPMANQNLTEDQARAVLEYLRQVNESQ